ncbi:MAG: glucokinase, partial [Nitrospinaceae bacterium]
MILAGDIGGTKVNLALFGEESGKLKPAEEARFESRRYSGLEDILEEYLHGTGRELDTACFGIAGPVKDEICRVTNLPWSVEAETLKKKLGLDSIWLINDLAAMACSVPFL